MSLQSCMWGAKTNALIHIHICRAIYILHVPNTWIFKYISNTWRQFHYLLYLYIPADSFNELLIVRSWEPYYSLISFALDAQCWRQNHRHHLNRPHLARCAGTDRSAPALLVYPPFDTPYVLTCRAWPFSPSSAATCSYCAPWRLLRVGHAAFQKQYAQPEEASSYRSYFFVRIASWQSTRSLFMVLKGGPAILPFATFTWETAVFHLSV